MAETQNRLATSVKINKRNFYLHNFCSSEKNCTLQSLDFVVITLCLLCC